MAAPAGTGAAGTDQEEHRLLRSPVDPRPTLLAPEARGGRRPCRTTGHQPGTCLERLLVAQAASQRLHQHRPPAAGCAQQQRQAARLQHAVHAVDDVPCAPPGRLPAGQLLHAGRHRGAQGCAWWRAQPAMLTRRVCGSCASPGSVPRPARRARRPCRPCHRRTLRRPTRPSSVLAFTTWVPRTRRFLKRISTVRSGTPALQVGGWPGLHAFMHAL